jgi:hypothetical protein
VDLNATFEVGTILNIPEIVELFQGHLIDNYWLPDPEGNKLYKLDFSNTTIAGNINMLNIAVLIRTETTQFQYNSTQLMNWFG